MSADEVTAAPPDERRRTTRQSRAVAAVVGELELFASAQSIHEFMTRQGESVGLSTVYRNLHALSEAGAIDSVRDPDGEVLYRKCGEVHRDHHHHLVCRRCGQAVELSGTAVERWVASAASEHGFSQITHEVEIFGLCPQCSDG